MGKINGLRVETHSGVNIKSPRDQLETTEFETTKNNFGLPQRQESKRRQEITRQVTESIGSKDCASISKRKKRIEMISFTPVLVNYYLELEDFII